MFTISHPKPEDAENIHKMIKDSWYATYINDKVGVTKKDLDSIYADDPAAQIQALINRAKNPTKEDISLVAKDNDKVLGFIRLKVAAKSIDLVSLYVHTEYFGKGVGTKLWQRGLTELPDDNRLITVELASYTKAKDFYETIGFVDTGKRYTKEGSKMLHSGTQIPLMKMIFER